jgi:hypothetical protein
MGNTISSFRASLQPQVSSKKLTLDGVLVVAMFATPNWGLTWFSRFSHQKKHKNEFKTL